MKQNNEVGRIDRVDKEKREESTEMEKGHKQKDGKRQRHRRGGTSRIRELPNRACKRMTAQVEGGQNQANARQERRAVRARLGRNKGQRPTSRAYQHRLQLAVYYRAVLLSAADIVAPRSARLLVPSQNRTACGTRRDSMLSLWRE